MIQFTFRCFVAGFMFGIKYHQTDSQSWVLFYKVMPFFSLEETIDKLYLAWELYNNPVAICKTRSLVKTAAELYAELLSSLGYDFLSQFEDLELILFYLQAQDYNLVLSLEQF